MRRNKRMNMRRAKKSYRARRGNHDIKMEERKGIKGSETRAASES
jgi:hypothetical protein